MYMVMSKLYVEIDTDEIANRVEQFIQSLPDVESDEYADLIDMDEDKFREMMEIYWHLNKLQDIVIQNSGTYLTDFYFMLMSQQDELSIHVQRIVGHETYVQMMVDGAI